MSTAIPDITPVKVAAIQLQTCMGDAAANIALAERMATEAFEAGTRVIGLPEFFTGAIAPCDKAFDVVLPKANAAIDMLRRLARKYGGHIGGSMLVADGDDIYNRYVFAGPEELHTHDKDLPTMWENVFYTGGQDDGVWDTDIGTVGAAVCWELIRHPTLKRMRGKVELAMTGTHWWTLPDNWPLVAPFLKAIGQYNRYMSEQAPVEFARRLGAPVLQASHCGPVSGQFLFGPGSNLGVDYRTHFVGASQIVDARGNVLASRNTAEGPGIVSADITPGSQAPVIAPEDNRYWVPEHTLFIKAYWHQQNWAGKSAYRRYGRTRGLQTAKRNASS